MLQIPQFYGTIKFNIKQTIIEPIKGTMQALGDGMYYPYNLFFFSNNQFKQGNRLMSLFCSAIQARYLPLVLLSIIFATFMAPINVAQANPELVADMTTEIVPQGSNPENLMALDNGLVVFTATTKQTGEELWASDGQSSWLLKDFVPGDSGAYFRKFTNAGNKLYFTVDGTQGYWQTDGTSAGTFNNPNLSPSIYGGFTVAGDKLYIIGNYGLNGSSESGVWMLDTASTSEPVKIISLSDVSVYVHPLIVDNNNRFYFYSDGSISYATSTANKLWVTDGTPSGTKLLTDTIPINFPTSVAAIGDTIFFPADASSDRSLWKSDGSASGTVMVKNIPALDHRDDLIDMTVLGDTLYFIADDFPRRLWKSGGTESGTVEIQLTGADRNTMRLIPAENSLYATETYPNPNSSYFSSTRDIWRISRTGAVELIRSISSPAPDPLFTLGDSIYFSNDKYIYKVVERYTLNVVFGVSNSSQYIRYHMVAENLLYFFLQDQDSNEFSLWSSDGTTSGTNKIKVIVPASTADAPSQPLFSHNLDKKQPIITPNNELFFSAADINSGAELWKSDGTTAGTYRVSNIQPDNADTLDIDIISDDDMSYLFLVNNYGTPSWSISNGLLQGLWVKNQDDLTAIKPLNVLVSLRSSFYRDGFVVNKLLTEDGLYFQVTNDNTDNAALWKTDGTEAGTIKLTDLPTDHYLTYGEMIAINGYVYFEVVTNQRVALWRSDGTLAGTKKVDDSSQLLGKVRNSLYYTTFDSSSNMHQLWKTDGTSSGTLIQESNSTYLEITTTDDLLYYRNADSLWRTDGSISGTIKLITSQLYISSLFPDFVDHVEIGNQLLLYAPQKYTAASAAFGLIVTNGTEQGTRIISNKSIMDVVKTNDSAFFFTKGKWKNSYELWVTDGTDTGTIKLKNLFGIEPNYYPNAFPIDLVAANNSVFFQLRDNPTGYELWTSNGTVNGTYRVKDIRQGTDGSNPSDFVSIGNKLYFSANDGIFGRELWVTDGTASGTQIIHDLVPGSSSSLAKPLYASGTDLYFLADDGVHGNELWKYETQPKPSGTAIIGDYIWSDDNGDGVQDSNEAGLGNVTIELMACNNNVIESTISDSNGQFLFDQLPAGDYRMRAILPTGFSFSPTGRGGNYQTDSNVNSDTGIGPCLSMAGGQQRLAIDIGLVPDGGNGGMNGTAALGDYLWSDDNGDGVQDANEAGLGSVTIELMTCNNNVIESTTSDNNGQFLLDQLLAGDYRMRVILPNGYRFSPAGQGGNYQTDSNVDALTGIGPCLSMADGQQRLAIDIGLVPDGGNGGMNGTAALGDYLWSDDNGDGVQDANEAGLGNVTIELMTCNNNVIESTTSDSNGQFLFDQLPAGDYRMRAILPTGYRFSPAGRSGNYQTDSNVNSDTGNGPCLSMADSQQRLAIDIGLVPDGW